MDRQGETASRLRAQAHRGMLPVQDDLGDVFHGVQEVIVSPLIPVDGHRAVFIHAARGTHGCPTVSRTSLFQVSHRQAPGHRGHHRGCLCPEEKRQGGSTLHLAQKWAIMTHRNPIVIGHRGEGGRRSAGRYRYLLGDRAPEVARSYSDRQTKEEAEERGETRQ